MVTSLSGLSTSMAEMMISFLRLCINPGTRFWSLLNVVCRVIGPRNAHVLISRTWASVSLHAEKDFEDVIKALGMGSWIISAGPI